MREEKAEERNRKRGGSKAPAAQQGPHQQEHQKVEGPHHHAVPRSIGQGGQEEARAHERRQAGRHPRTLEPPGPPRRGWRAIRGQGPGRRRCRKRRRGRRSGLGRGPERPRRGVPDEPTVWRKTKRHRSGRIDRRVLGHRRHARDGGLVGRHALAEHEAHHSRHADAHHVSAVRRRVSSHVPERLTAASESHLRAARRLRNAEGLQSLARLEREHSWRMGEAAQIGDGQARTSQPRMA